MIGKKDFYVYNLSEKDKEYCLKHAKKMSSGFSTYSFKNDEKQSTDVYNIGKVGEFAFFKFLKQEEKAGRLNIKHVPFRESYDKINFKDDFIIEIDGVDYQIEVRTKGRGVEPRVDYECCTDCIKPKFIYVFISFNKKTETATVLGYANWMNFKNNATVSLKGDENSNFKHKVDEFNIEIKYLSSIYRLVDDYSKNEIGEAIERVREDLISGKIK